MTAEIITIGDEILIGQIVDRNSAFIAQELGKIGISVHQITSIQDEKQHILTALKEASGRTDMVIVTGGLGPTKDDITKASFCEYFGDRLVKNDEVLHHIETLFFSKYKGVPLSNLNKEQALVPSKAKVLHNENGTAPGMWMEKNNIVYIALPGVPYEMEALTEQQVIPLLQKKFKRPFIYHKTILAQGMGESAIADKLEVWEDNLPSFLKFAYLPDRGKVRLRLSGKGDDEQELILEVERQVEGLCQILGEVIVPNADLIENIVVQINKLLTAKGRFLSVAESCTGGGLAAMFTVQPGASSCFKGGLVCYATKTKMEVLQVQRGLIEKYSVVSGEVAEEMAKKARRMFNTDYALSTTGNAGPTKGDSNAEVGTVFIGLAGPEKVVSEKFHFGNNREQVIGQTINKAFEMLLKELTSE